MSTKGEKYNILMMTWIKWLMMAGQSNWSSELIEEMWKVLVLWQIRYTEKLLSSSVFSVDTSIFVQKEFSKRNAGRPGGLYPQLVQYFVSKSVVGVPASTLNGISSGISYQCKAMKSHTDWISPIFLNMSFSVKQPVRGNTRRGVNTQLFGVVTAASMLVLPKSLYCTRYSWVLLSSFIQLHIMRCCRKLFLTTLWGFHTRSEKKRSFLENVQFYTACNYNVLGIFGWTKCMTIHW